MHSNHTTQQLKACTKCGKEFPKTLEFFCAHKEGRDGLNPQCKECDRAYREANRKRLAEYQRAWRKANREKIAGWGKEYYQANRDRIQERNKAYHQTNREKTKENRSAWAAANPEKMLEYGRRYYRANREKKLAATRERAKKNPDQQRAKRGRRRARVLAAPGSHTAADIQSLYAAQEGRCAYCNAEVGQNYHVDHVVPLSRGGSNWPDNLAIACPSCNSSKNDKLLEEWEGGSK